MLRVPRIAQILRHMHVQMVGVRIDQAGSQAGQPAQEIAARFQPCGQPLLVVRREHQAQNLASAVSQNHQRADKEAAMQIGPQNGDHRQHSQNRHAHQARTPFPHLFQRGIKEDQEQQGE